MKFREYYELTKETSDYSLKIIGVIFTSISLIIVIIFGYQNYSINDLLEIFVLCFLLGNGFGFFIWVLAITSAFGKAKSLITFYDSIPEEIKEKLGFELFVLQQNPKYNFLELDILNSNSEIPILLKIDKKFVLIDIGVDLKKIENFQKRIFEIQKKYKKENITLTGWGLRKTIKWKDWLLIDSDKFQDIINELKQISNKENFDVVKRDINN